MRATTQQIRTLRHRLNLSQAKACAIAGVPTKTWERWDASPEASNHAPPPGIAANFLALMDIMVNDLKMPLDKLTAEMHRKVSQIK